MTKPIITFLFICLSWFVSAANDSTHYHVEIDTLNTYTSDSCLAYLELYNGNSLIEKRTAILVWYKVKIDKETRKEKQIKSKYGINLEVINHGARVEFLDSNQTATTRYEYGKIVSNTMRDNQTLNSTHYKCTKDILYVYIISEYGFPRKAKNKRNADY